MSEFGFRTSRSSGPGGQNVNKVESRVEVLFNIERCRSFTDQQRARVFLRLGNRIDSKGILHVISRASRSQWENKMAALEELAYLIRAAIKPDKKRVPTNPSPASKERRLKRKKIRSEKKRMRHSPGID